jgi:hypothetical protein
MAKNNYGTASEVGLQSAFLASSGFKGPGIFLMVIPGFGE